ncbi:MAG: hypothetical protein V7K92_25260 [Nostoc sp.]|uniref:hypothetical protein n=1 Tax=Nostoc sp. TaxID=1180 RepID=UPI002FF07DCD
MPSQSLSPDASANDEAFWCIGTAWLFYETLRVACFPAGVRLERDCTYWLPSPRYEDCST